MKIGEWKATLATLAAVLLATLVTPYGVNTWTYAALIATEASAPGVVSTLGEMSATFGATARSAPAFWFFAALLALVVGATSHALASRHRLSLARCENRKFKLAFRQCPITGILLSALKSGIRPPWTEVQLSTGVS